MKLFLIAALLLGSVGMAQADKFHSITGVKIWTNCESTDYWKGNFKNRQTVCTTFHGIKKWKVTIERKNLVTGASVRKVVFDAQRK